MSDPLPRLPQEAITDLARRIVTNEVYMVNDPREVQLSFSTILLFAQGLPPNLGGIWEEWSKAASRSINGRPMFFSAHLFPLEDIPALLSEIERLRQALGLSPTREASAARSAASGRQNGGHD